MRDLRIGLYADGRAIARPLRTPIDLSVGHMWDFWLPDNDNYGFWGWRVAIAPQHPDALAALVQERMLGGMWLPILVGVRDASGQDVGEAAPSMLFTGRSDCPSVTWIAAYRYERAAALVAYQVSLNLVDRE